MRTRRLETLVLLGAALAGTGCGDPTTADSKGEPDQPEQTTAATWTPVTSCNTTITSPGEYRLVKNLLNCTPYTQAAISIASNDVVLKLNGYRISLGTYRSAPQQGITVGGSNVQVLGPGAVDYFEFAVNFNGATHSVLRGVTIKNFGEYGLGVAGASDLRIQLNTIIGNAYRAVHMNGNDILFAHNRLFGGEVAIEMTGDRNKILENDIQPGPHIAPYIGIDIRAGTGNVVSGNRVLIPWGMMGVWIHSGSIGNQVIRNSMVGHDIADDNPCGSNTWVENRFRIAYPDCLD